MGASERPGTVLRFQHQDYSSSIKAEAAIDWSTPDARRAFLAGIVADGDRLLETARSVREGLTAFTRVQWLMAAAAANLTLVWSELEAGASDRVYAVTQPSRIVCPGRARGPRQVRVQQGGPSFSCRGRPG